MESVLIWFRLQRLYAFHLYNNRMQDIRSADVQGRDNYDSQLLWWPTHESLRLFSCFFLILILWFLVLPSLYNLFLVFFDFPIYHKLCFLSRILANSFTIIYVARKFRINREFWIARCLIYEELVKNMG